MRKIAITWRSLALFAVLAACPAHSQTAVAGKPKGVAHVYLLRGFLNVFSPGIDELGEKLGSRGIDVSVNNHLTWAGLAEQAAENCKNGREGSIILIGHSLGAGAVVSMAERLERDGMKVNLMVTLDPVVRVSVPGNVKRAENYYLSNGMGTALDHTSSFHGALQNIDMKSHSELGHVSLTTSDAVQRQIMSDVLGALHGQCR
jgi:hypothetical protein